MLQVPQVRPVLPVPLVLKVRLVLRVRPVLPVPLALKVRLVLQVRPVRSYRANWTYRSCRSWTRHSF